MHGNKQPSPFLNFYKTKLKKKDILNKTNNLLFSGNINKSIIKSFRGDISKEKRKSDCLNDKILKNSPDSIIKSNSQLNDNRELSGENKEKKSGTSRVSVNNLFKNKNKIRDNVFDDYFMKKMQKIYSKKANPIVTKHKYKNGVFNHQSSNNGSSLRSSRLVKNNKVLCNNSNSNFYFDGKLFNQNNNSCLEENKIGGNSGFTNFHYNKSDMIINNSGIRQSSSNSIQIIIGDKNISENNIITNSNNSIKNSKQPINSEKGYVGNSNLMKHIENKYEVNNSGVKYEKKNEDDKIKGHKNSSEFIIKKINNHNRIKSSVLDGRINSKIKKLTTINDLINNKHKKTIPKFLAKYIDPNLHGINITQKKGINILPSQCELSESYAEFGKMSKTSTQSKNNSGKSSFDKKNIKGKQSSIPKNSGKQGNYFIINSNDNYNLCREQTHKRSDINNKNFYHKINNVKKDKDKDKNNEDCSQNYIYDNVNNNINDENYFERSAMHKGSCKSCLNQVPKTNIHQIKQLTDTANSKVLISGNYLIKSYNLSSNNNISSNNNNNSQINSGVKINENKKIEEPKKNSSIKKQDNNKNYFKKITNNKSFKQYRSSSARNTLMSSNKLDNLNRDKFSKYSKIIQNRDVSGIGNNISNIKTARGANDSGNITKSSNIIDYIGSDIIYHKKIPVKNDSSVNSKNHSKSNSKVDKIEEYSKKWNSSAKQVNIKARIIKNSVPITSFQSPRKKVIEDRVGGVNKPKESQNFDNKKEESNYYYLSNYISNAENKENNCNEPKEKYSNSNIYKANNDSDKNKVIKDNIAVSKFTDSKKNQGLLDYDINDLNEFSPIHESPSFSNLENKENKQKVLHVNINENDIASINSKNNKINLNEDINSFLCKNHDLINSSNDNNNISNDAERKINEYNNTKRNNQSKKHINKQKDLNRNMTTNINKIKRLIKGRCENEKSKDGGSAKNTPLNKMFCTDSYSKEKKKLDRIQREKNNKSTKIKKIKKDEKFIKFTGGGINIPIKIELFGHFKEKEEKDKSKNKKEEGKNKDNKNVKKNEKIEQKGKEQNKEKDKDKKTENKDTIENEIKKIEKKIEEFNTNTLKKSYKDMLCEPLSPEMRKREETIFLTTASKDCDYYKDEMERVSKYIKKYYLENGEYPSSQIEFYLYGRQIGHGAFGKVNLALHVASGRLVAIKIFSKKNLKNKRAKQKIKHEIEILSKLRHPFINQILDSFETEKHIFIVMEYVCGDLLGFIRKRGKLSESITKLIFKQIIEGLKYIHGKKIVHRDIKLDNVLIDLTNTVKICDFGVSKKIIHGDIMYDHCGTPAYIAPEIFQNQGYEGYLCDVWSAGVTLYYMLSGLQPFRANSIKELEKVVRSGKYDPIEDVSKEANNLIDLMLQVEPSERITINEILLHPWLKNVDLNNRKQLNLFTEAEKILLSKFDVDYLFSNKEELIEKFTLKNLETNNDPSNVVGNTKSVIFAPYNSCIEEPKEKSCYDGKIKKHSEDEIYKELEVLNDACKFGFQVQQANIKYELSNNNDFDNGIIKTQKEEDFNCQNEAIEKKNEEKLLNEKISGLNSPRVKSANDSFEETEKIIIKKDILKHIEENIGYDSKYIINCLKKKKINYATATYYLLLKENQYKY